MELQEPNNHQLASTLTCKELIHVNLLINPSFPIPDKMIEIWGQTLIELAPNLSDSILKSIIDKFKKNQLEWNFRIGIQNIFIGYLDYLDFKQDFYKSEQRLISDRGIPNEGKENDFKELQDKIILISKEINIFSKPKSKQIDGIL